VGDFRVQVIAGVLLLVNRYVPLAVAILAPVLVNILTFHALMALADFRWPFSCIAMDRDLHRSATGVFPGCFSRAFSRGLSPGEKS